MQSGHIFLIRQKEYVRRNIIFMKDDAKESEYPHVNDIQNKGEVSPLSNTLHKNQPQ